MDQAHAVNIYTDIANVGSIPNQNAKAKELKPIHVTGIPTEASKPKSGVNAKAKELKAIRVPGMPMRVKCQI